MKDDAVAPVVAAMLVLAVIVTVLSAWNAILLPSLKQQSEIVQDREVQEAFSRFSSDLATAASLKRDLTFSQPLPLGGGGVIFSPLTSAGTILVREEPHQVYNITITDAGVDHIADGRLVNFSYRPVGDFWLDQGYVWHYGYVNVTKGSSPHGPDGAALATPLQYPTPENATRSAPVKKFAASLVEAEAEPWYNSSSNVSHIMFSSVTFRQEPGMGYASGNGIGMFSLTAAVNETQYGVAGVSSPGAVTVYVNRVQPESFPLALYAECNRSFAGLAEKYPGNVVHTFASGPEYKMTRIAPVAGSLPFDVAYRQVAVNVSVH
jgi:hypothetical protein